MKVLYFNVIEQHAGWGAEWFTNRALLALGHETFCIDYREHRSTIAAHALKTPQCDVLFLQRGDHFPRRILEAANIPRVFWISELIDRQNDFHHLLQPPAPIDFAFFRTPTCINRAVDAGWIPREKTGILLSSFDPETYCCLPVEKKYEVSFVGNMTPRRRAFIDRLHSAGIAVHVESAFGSEANQVFNASQIVINIHAEDNLDTETRIYEVLGSGAFLLSEPLSIESPFTALHLAFFENVEDCIQKIRHFLAHLDQARQIACAGHAEVVAHHSYKNRAIQLSQCFQQLIGNRNHAGKPNFRRLPLYVEQACSLLRMVRPH